MPVLVSLLSQPPFTIEIRFNNETGFITMERDPAPGISNPDVINLIKIADAVHEKINLLLVEAIRTNDSPFSFKIKMSSDVDGSGETPEVGLDLEQFMTDPNDPEVTFAAVARMRSSVVRFKAELLRDLIAFFLKYRCLEMRMQWPSKF